MKPLHKELKDVRVEKRISLEDVFRETKIRVSFLEKIEAGDFSVVPEPFMRAFLREYAVVVGLDPDRVISRYEGEEISIRDAEPSSVAPAPAAEKPSSTPAAPPPVPAAKPPKGSRKKPAVPVAPEEPSAPAAPTPELPVIPVNIPSGTDENPGIAPAVAETAVRGEPPLSPRPSVSDILTDSENKAPGAILVIVFGVIVIIAALVIIYFNGSFGF